MDPHPSQTQGQSSRPQRPPQQQQTDRGDPAPRDADGNAGPLRPEGYDEGSGEGHGEEESGHDADYAEGAELRLRHGRAVQVAMYNAHHESEASQPLRPQTRVRGDGASQPEKRQSGEGGTAAGRGNREARGAPQQPRSGQSEEGDPARVRPLLARQQGKGQRRQEILRRKREVETPS